MGDTRLRKALKAIRSASGPLLWSSLSYAQEGEDIVIRRILGGGARGFYVDVGCHHPFRFSNTYLFYRRGWRGICIDPLPGMSRRFGRWRPRDIALELGVSAEPGEMTYYMFDEAAVNTFDRSAAQRVREEGKYKLIGTRTVQTLPLREIIANYAPESRKEVDLLSVDAEGMDLEVLRSNDWGRFRPKVVVAECFDSTLLTVHDHAVVVFMREMGYHPHAKTGHSVVFRGAEE